MLTQFKILCASALMMTLLFSAQEASAAAVEQFDYPEGNLDTLNGGTGWAGPWSGGGTTMVVASPGLDSFSLNGEAGNTAFAAGGNDRSNRILSQTYSSGTVYLSVLMQQTSDAEFGNPGGPFTALELSLGADPGDGRIFSFGLLRNDDGNPPGQETDFAARVQDGAGGDTLEVASLVPFDTNLNLFLTRFDLDADTAEVFFNPTSLTDLNGPGQGSLTLFSGFSFDRLSLANFVGQNATSYDEIRIDTTPPDFAPLTGPAVPGDVDDNGTVDILDFNVIRDNFRLSVAAFTQGDLSGPASIRDGVVDFHDFIEWSSAFESSGGSLAGLDLSFTSAVPEPTSALAMLMALTAWGSLPWRRR